MHKAKLVEVKALSDGALSIRARCCEDPSTDSCRTIYGLEQHTEETLTAESAAHCADVERKHAATETALAYLKSQVR